MRLNFQRNNHFRKKWLTQKDPNGDYITKWCKLTSDSQFLKCIWCRADLNISSKGITALYQHAKSAKHKQKRELMLHGTNSDDKQSQVADKSKKSSPDSHLLKDLPAHRFKKNPESPSGDSADDEVRSPDKVAQLEFKSVPKPPQFIGYSRDNCYVCNAKLGSFKSELSTVTSSTETPLYEILGGCYFTVLTE